MVGQLSDRTLSFVKCVKDLKAAGNIAALFYPLDKIINRKVVDLVDNAFSVTSAGNTFSKLCIHSTAVYKNPKIDTKLEADN